ncbi:MAG: hypothetical protein ACFFE4_03865 [Candidatus Thorarchaeota archaeon]
MLISLKNKYKISILTWNSLGIIGVYLLFWLNSSLIITAFSNYEGALQVVLVISIRIIVLSIITAYLLNKWFKQEAQYLSDIPFLLSMFFLILIFGKAVDLFWNLTYFTFNDTIVLLLLKARYFIIICEVTPLVYLGFEIIFFRLEDKFTKLRDKKYMNNLRARLIVLIFTVETIVVFSIPDVTMLGRTLPVILIPSLLGIVYIFYLAYRLNRLTVVKPKILTIGFLLYMISNIFRPLMQSILGETSTYIIVVEIVDLLIFVLIFFGLYKKDSK